MKIIHLSDLHIGKRVNDFSMIEDQQYILNKIVEIIDDVEPKAVLIAGDVYDKTNPSDEAVRLFGRFLNSLAKRKLEVFIIGGNHDSQPKLAFASELIEDSGVHIAPEYNGNIKKYTVSDGNDSVNIYMLPFIRPAMVKSVWPEEADNINNYTDAVRVALTHSELRTCAEANGDAKEKSFKDINILVAHQFVTGANRCESEEVSVGGLDNVDGSIFDDFDYVALGHIHGPQKVGRETIRYCGTPLKYSFSEKDHHKSVTVLDIRDGMLEIGCVPLIPDKDIREINGYYEELVLKENYQNTSTKDYLSVVLKDEEEIVDAIAKLRVIYPNIMKVSYDNTRTRSRGELRDIEGVEHKDPIEVFDEFYEMQNNKPMSEEQREYVQNIISEIWGKQE